MNGITSSCKSDSCSFEYKSTDTATVYSVNPAKGFGYSSCQSGGMVYVSCVGCGWYVDDNKVYFGEVEAKVESVDQVISVCPGKSRKANARCLMLNVKYELKDKLLREFVLLAIRFS